MKFHYKLELRNKITGNTWPWLGTFPNIHTCTFIHGWNKHSNDYSSSRPWPCTISLILIPSCEDSLLKDYSSSFEVTITQDSQVLALNPSESYSNALLTSLCKTTENIFAKEDKRQDPRNALTSFSHNLLEGFKTAEWRPEQKPVCNAYCSLPT